MVEVITMFDEYDEKEDVEVIDEQEADDSILDELPDEPENVSSDFVDLDELTDKNQNDIDSEGLEKLYQDAIESNDAKNAEKYDALLEISSLRDDLELTKGDSDYVQAGGLYKDLIGKYNGYEIHHIPAKSVQDANARYLPAIALTAQDHSCTDSYRYKSNKTYDSFLPDSKEGHTYKDDAKDMISQGRYLDLVRDELYNIKDNFGDRYDGGIEEYLNCLYQQISENGVPK